MTSMQTQPFTDWHDTNAYLRIDEPILVCFMVSFLGTLASIRCCSLLCICVLHLCRHLICNPALCAVHLRQFPLAQWELYHAAGHTPCAAFQNRHECNVCAEKQATCCTSCCYCCSNATSRTSSFPHSQFTQRARQHVQTRMHS